MKIFVSVLFLLLFLTDLLALQVQGSSNARFSDTIPTLTPDTLSAVGTDTLKAATDQTLTQPEKVSYGSRIYSANIKTQKNNQQKITGYLFQIKDSSVVISNASSKKYYLSGKFQTNEYNYRNIYNISLRNSHSITRGALIGGGIGFALPLLILYSDHETSQNDEAQFVAYSMATMTMLIGSGVGALLGSFRMNIPINGNFSDFETNKDVLKKYSLVNEPSITPKKKWPAYNWYLGYGANLSIPLGGFEAGIPGNTAVNHPQVGGSSNIMIGYTFKNNIGISIAFLNNSYEVKDSNYWWNMQGFLIGPTYSLRFLYNLKLDLKLQAGAESVFYGSTEVSDETSSGFAIYPNVLLMYNFSPRWSVLTEAGYLYSHVRFINPNNINICQLGIGIGYSFY